MSTSSIRPSSPPLKRLWRVRPPAPQEHLRALSELPSLIARLLCNRGITSISEAEVFFAPERVPPHDPMLLPGVPEAVGRMLAAIRNGESIAVFGDFDADGVTSAAVLTEGLQQLGANVTPYIPHRLEEGHGLNMAAIRQLRERDIRLIITGDCGSSSAEEVAAATELGMDVVVTDHHTPPEILPRAVAVVNPKLPGSAYPFAHLASVGVAYKVMAALYQAAGKTVDETLLELVALGTVTDMAPLVGENRTLVCRGLKYLQRTARPGVRALALTAGLTPERISAESVSYALGPRLNAAGRIDHASISYQLLVTRSVEEAQRLAQELNTQNASRQRLTQEAFAEALALAADCAAEPALVLGTQQFKAGVVGLVASKLVDAYYRPAIVYQEGPKETRASARSIPEFNVIAALTACKDLFIQFGGHPQAAGFTIATEKLSEFKERFRALALEQLADLELAPALTVDAEVKLPDLSGDVLRRLQGFVPSGVGNPQPTFLSRKLEVREARPLGDGTRHVSLKLRGPGSTWPAVLFNTTEPFPRLGQMIDAVFTLRVESWSGQRFLQLQLLDWRPSQ